MPDFIFTSLKAMGQEVSVSSDINIINHVIHYDGKQSRSPLLRSLKSSREEIKNIKSNPMDDISADDDSEEKKICIIICNSYDHTPYALGDCALNDGILSFYEISKFGYKAYLYHDITKAEFKHILLKALRTNADKLVVYYIGHGTRARNRNEKDGWDECILCMDGAIVDDELANIVLKNNQCKKVSLISDCCHSGSIYDIPSREDIITLGACQDDQTAKQDWIDHRGNGVFSYYFWKFVKNVNDATNLKKKIDAKIHPYRQECVFNFLTDEVL